MFNVTDTSGYRYTNCPASTKLFIPRLIDHLGKRGTTGSKIERIKLGKGPVS